MKDRLEANNLRKTQYAAVILAAGYSSRMKAFKPLLPVGETTAIERSVDSAKEAGIRNIIVVTGHNREKLAPAIKGAGVTEAYNNSYEEGMFSSIKVGLSAVKNSFDDIKGAVLMPVDCPLISGGVIGAVMQSADGDKFCVPVFEGKKGHPLLIPSSYFEEICGYDGPGGLKSITDKYWDKMKRVPVDEEGCVLDMDTPEGYEEIKAFLAAGQIREPLEMLAEGRRIFLVRHGQTRRHDEKMFIGRYDVPLEESALSDLCAMAARLMDELDGCAGLKKIYCSPLKRAVQTADVIRSIAEEKGKTKCGIEICMIDDLQEISLGGWDGRPIREIKEKYPEEYDRRGQDVFAFKIGNKAENFYDVQYRAVKALRNILEADDAQDIVIVSHNAVIRSLENNLKGLKVNDEWEMLGKGMYRVIKI